MREINRVTNSHIRPLDWILYLFHDKRGKEVPYQPYDIFHDIIVERGVTMVSLIHKQTFQFSLVLRA